MKFYSKFAFKKMLLKMSSANCCPFCSHDDVIKWKHFLRNWPFVRGIHRGPVNSPHKGQWRGALIVSLICVWINDWVNNREAGDLRRYCAHYYVIIMQLEGVVEGVSVNCLLYISELTVGDMVWVKYRAMPHWPALVSRITGPSYIYIWLIRSIGN